MADPARRLAACAALLIGPAASPAASAEPARLSGVVIAGSDRVAIFAGRSGEPSIVVHEGDLVSGDRIVRIAAGIVILDGATGRRAITFGEDPGARDTHLVLAPPPGPVVDPYRRERETENDQ